ncbi:unnamed protein product [Cuscuta epithymum]|uniref:Uncharacterized protein n=1 Tax=Cuscuta epithymum TaxID=186058 RepID=A0AAV0BZU6_9ASTE|nr:unnamed protein product [Cuscuta epithymum]
MHKKRTSPIGFGVVFLRFRLRRSVALLCGFRPPSMRLSISRDRSAYMAAKGCVSLATGGEVRGCRSWLRSKGHGRSVGLGARSDLDRRQGAEDASVLLDRPPLELPSWSAREFRVWKQYFNFIICLLFNFHGQTVLFYFYFFLCYKTLALGLGDERSTLIIIGFMLPKLGLASYIDLSKVINSESRPRADGYMWSFCYPIPLLNAILLI